MELYHDGVRLGALSRYFYETPWASARLIADDRALRRHLRLSRLVRAAA